MLGVSGVYSFDDLVTGLQSQYRSFSIDIKPVGGSFTATLSAAGHTVICGGQAGESAAAVLRQAIAKLHEKTVVEQTRVASQISNLNQARLNVAIPGPSAPQKFEVRPVQNASPVTNVNAVVERLKLEQARARVASSVSASTSSSAVDAVAAAADRLKTTSSGVRNTVARLYDRSLDLDGLLGDLQNEIDELEDELSDNPLRQVSIRSQLVTKRAELVGYEREYEEVQTELDRLDPNGRIRDSL